MKTKFIAIIVLISTNLLLGQSYIPIINLENEWNILVVDDYFGPGHTEKTWCTYKQIIGDTITIDNLVYNQIKVIKDNDCIQRENGNSLYYTDFLLREDTLNKQVFLLEENSNSSFEKLLYDFSLKPNDTIIYYFNGTNEPHYFLKVDSIKNIDFGNGFKTNIFYNSIKFAHEIEYSKCCTWVEGVGGYEGIRSYELEGTVGSNIYSSLLCFKKNGDLIYMNPDYETCDENYNGVKEIGYKKLKILTNPVTNYLSVELPEDEFWISYLITDISGKLILSDKIHTQNNLFINVAELQSGLYFIQVKNGQGKFAIGKFIVD